VIRVPYAPPSDSVASRAPAPRAIEIPFAPPPEDDGAAVDAQGSQQGIEKQFAAADTLGQVMAREGFGTAGPNVIAALNKLVDPRTIRGGAKYVVHMGDDGTPDGFEYQPTPALRYLVEREDAADGAKPTWTARKLEASVEIKTIEAGGAIESSLYESVQKSGESTSLVSLLVELFAWDVNFYIDTHPGDHWKVLIEKQYLGGQFYKYGRVLAAEYGGKVGTFRAFYWAGKDAPRDRPGKYYDEKGLAVSKSMLKTPLRFVRISSKFDRKRLHPILHVERAHLGIDYAAPVGTPVWASASGRVVEAGMKRGSGNTSSSRTRTGSRRATTTCRSSRAGCASACRSGRRTSSASSARPAVDRPAPALLGRPRTARSSIPASCRSAATRPSRSRRFIDAIRPASPP
jgi:murein DD-endopeptidase MepM/ murein hydrolase activator NlpD